MEQLRNFLFPKMSWLFNCSSLQEDWDERERNYIREVNKYKETCLKMKEEKNVMEQHFAQDTLNWRMKEDEYLERINDLQNRLHQQEVVTQQFKIREGNFQMDRQQFQDNQKQLEKYDATISMQKQQISELKQENKKYLETILDLTRAAMGSDYGKELRASERLNGNVPHITESVLV